MEENPQADVVGQSGEGVVPWTLLTGVDAKNDHRFFTEELWCGAAVEVALDSSDTHSFLRDSVEFANERLFGNLSCSLFVHPDTEKAHPKEVDTAIADLRYGSVSVNANTQLGFGLMKLRWGAFPGNTPQNIQSGTGQTHNSMLFDYTEVCLSFRRDEIHRNSLIGHMLCICRNL